MAITSTPFVLFEPYEKGTKRSLRFDVNALADFEERTGMGFSQLMHTKAIWAGTRAMLWAGLKHEDNFLTMDRVGELMGLYVKDEKAIHNVNELLVEAMAAAQEQGAFGQADEASAKKLRAAKDRFVAVAAQLTEAEASGALPVLDAVPEAVSGDRG
jgi:hypothetical protein